MELFDNSTTQNFNSQCAQCLQMQVEFFFFVEVLIGISKCTLNELKPV